MTWTTPHRVYIFLLVVVAAFSAAAPLVAAASGQGGSVVDQSTSMITQSRAIKGCASFLAAPACRRRRRRLLIQPTSDMTRLRNGGRTTTIRRTPGACAFIHAVRGGAGETRSLHSHASQETAAQSTIATKKSPHPRHRISYLTDVEGSRDYLHRFVECSKVLTFVKCEKTLDFPYDHCLDFHVENSADMLVYGGDVWDQGGSDLYVIRQLLHFKRRHSNRLYFVAGNRDLNKMRVTQEMGLMDMAPEHGGVYWLRGSGQTGDPETGGLPRDMTAVERLQWMLAKTMGSPRAFEYRQQELEQELGRAVDPSEVVESYRSSCHVTGEMGQYLAQAALVVQLGDALFVHGCLPLTDEVLQEHADGGTGSLWDDLTFAMPWLGAGETAQDHNVHNISDWIAAVNDFCKANVQDWRAQAQRPSDTIWSTTGGYQPLKASQRFCQLIQYGMGWTPDSVRNPTVVYSSWSNDGMPRKFFPDASDIDQQFVKATKDFFEATGTALICSGHQPQGDMPNAIRVNLKDENRTGWILSCDTSYSGDTMWHNAPSDAVQRENPGRGTSLSGRGDVAVSEVLIEQCSASGKTLSVVCHGTLCDGTEYETQALDLRGASENDKNDNLVVGRIATGPLVPDKRDSPHGGLWWTRAAFKDGSKLLTTAKGFEAWNRIVKP